MFLLYRTTTTQLVKTSEVPEYSKQLNHPSTYGSSAIAIIIHLFIYSHFFRYETQRLLRGEELAAGRTVRVPPHRSTILCSRSEGYKSWEGKRAYTAVPMFHRSSESIRLSRPHTSLAGARSLWSTAAGDRDDPPIPRWDKSTRAE